MLNIIWGAMIVFGITVGILGGKADALTSAVIDGGKTAVNLCITMAGIISIWTGIMKIAEKSGLIDLLSEKLNPVLRALFPEIPVNHPANKYISTNLAANFLGLGWAATPAGLSAMKELQKLNRRKDRPSHAMSMFMIINMSSVQLITVSILAYRSQFLSKAPGEIIVPGIIATSVSTTAGIISGKIFEQLFPQ